MHILGIETSCDETSGAVVTSGIELRSNVVASQDALHAPYGGIVPEIASRAHIERIESVVDEALQKAGLGMADIGGIAVTSGPGLLGSLIVGLSYAKALAYARKIPFYGINHLEAHLHAIFLEKQIAYPFIGLIVSGGHTALYEVNGVGRIELLGATRDDAAGEAFDKAAKLLGLGYPGGRQIDQLAQKGCPDAIDFPRPYQREQHCHFSFSGLKTAVLNDIKKRQTKPSQQELCDIAASFQEAVCETLVYQSLKALKQKRLRRLVVAGGVAANSRLRTLFNDCAKKEAIEVSFPSLPLCTDNAAMVAALGYHYLKENPRGDPLSLNAYAHGAV